MARPDPEPQRVLLALVDISGYTRFMLDHDDKPLRHSQMIIGELLETLLRQVDVPLELSRVEGDALFLYAVRPDDEEVWRRRRAGLVQRLHAMFALFTRRLAEIGAYSVCRCDACATVGRLELKMILHSGEALLTAVGDHPTLSGLDVVTLHRLAKNSLELSRYVLMTEEALRDLGAPEGVDLIEGEETYDLGTVRTFSYVPEVPTDFDERELQAGYSEENVAVQILRDEIRREYTDVARSPERGFHFNTGRKAASVLGYDPAWLDGVPEDVVTSFAGTGNPLGLGELAPGDYVLDVGSGAGLDSIIAARLVGEGGHVIGVEMTEAMLAKARAGAGAMGLRQLEFRDGFMEHLPVPDGWADVIISNGAVNLAPNKDRVFAEMFRVLRPGGRLQIADITVDRPVPEGAKRDIDLWTN